ncbi:MAG: ABC transporter permease [Gammaproteobacteria bacterium]|nr:ABC transporter permease [Gammaproteobacteria bacterium]
MKNALFIAWQDVRSQLRQGATLLWVFLMPPIFFYFIGTVTGGFSSGLSGAQATPITVVAESPGFLQAQLDKRLGENDFAAQWSAELSVDEAGNLPARILTIEKNLSEAVQADEPVEIRFETKANALSRQFEEIRIQRALYTVLADIVVAHATAGPVSALALESLNEAPRVWQLEVAAAGQRQDIPSGFDQAVPGILVMFTLLVLLTSSGTMLVQERTQGLLRRLASTPISRAEVVAGKWQGRMVLAAVQISVALVFGTFLFSMDWGPDIGMITVVLIAWGSFCASAGLWLGTVARTEAQAAGLGVLAANVLAALGGCWWPIEVTPQWMQAIQKLLPTGWTMDALHKLISFQAGWASVIPNVFLLLAAAVIFAWLATRKFTYE